MTAQSRAKAIVDAFTNDDTADAKFRRIVNDYCQGKGWLNIETLGERCLLFVTDLRKDVLSVLKTVRRTQAVTAASEASDRQVVADIGFPDN